MTGRGLKMIVTPCNWARVTVLEVRRSGKTSLKMVAWQLRHEGEVGVSHAEDSGGEVWEKNRIPGRGNSMWRGPEEEKSLSCWKNHRQVNSLEHTKQ